MERFGKSIRRHWLAWAIGACLASMGSSAWAVDLMPLRAQFALPDDRVDFAEVKLVVDRLIDPATDTVSVRRELDRWEGVVRSQVPAGATARQALDALLKTLYQPGSWNEGRPFEYDLADPLGRNPKAKQLAVYLATRKGNCVSMPILVAILGQRLGLPLTLATAPDHLLVKFADDTQQAWVNVEATAGGFKFDSSYERETGITPAAIENGLYLRPLTPRESVGVIAGALMEHYGAREEGDAILEVADLALAANARDPVAMVWKANAYYLQLHQRYVSRYPDAADIPPAQHGDFSRLSHENLAWFAQAERLGWVQRTPEQEQIYLQSIQREQAKRGL
ncbi:transglutaminase family protein [Luteimonas sp. RD2P54]|uniref:Transglutaminase family protein n=1 Tax=Luteimonas endophytica TaxID=3042023 RepID=A0ABT6JCJ1_9GAMM|nr:transglutaminase family protein [Luteimonas endophytica]MDH5824285.1 transglutaminase family protein [Luteimonas endophytica]